MRTKTKVWTSEAWADPDYIKFVSFESGPHDLEASRKFRRGEYTDSDWIPKEVYPDNPNVILSNIFRISGSFVLVSEKVAKLLRSFDLGNNQLIETTLYDHAKKKKQEGKYFFLNVTEKKANCFDREASKGRFLGSVEQGFLTSTTAYGGIAVREAAVLGGVDLWMDPILGQTPFFSGRLGSAIMKGKFGRTGLKPCVVVP